MALIWMDGFDAYGQDGANVAALLNSSGYVLNAGSQVSLVSSDTATGVGFSLQAYGGHNGDDGTLVRAFTSVSGLVMGFRYKTNSQLLDMISEIGYTNLLGSFVCHLKLMMNGENGISVTTEASGHVLGNAGFGPPNNPGALVAASPPNVLFTGVWQYIEVKFQPGVLLQVKIDGGLVINVSSPVTTSGLPATVNWAALGNDNNATQLYDDYYLCDLSGGAFDTFLGDVVVHSVFPNADASPNEMTQFGGGVGHFTSVDEQTPDEDVSYMHSNTAGQQELYGLSTIPIDLITVLAVQVNVRAKKSAAGLGQYQISAKYAGTQVDSDPIVANIGYVEQHVILTAPPGGGSWTKVIAQATLIGFKIPS